MSHFESTFLAFKKSGTSCPNWGEVIWTKSKRTATFFFVKPSLKLFGQCQYRTNTFQKGASFYEYIQNACAHIRMKPHMPNPHGQL